MNEFFETTFGDKIALMPRVELILYPLSTDEAYVRNSLENSFASERFLQKKVFNKARITDVTRDLSSFTLVIDFLEELRLLTRQYDTALDIAGAPGIHAALLRGHYAKYVDVADVRDGSDPDLTRRLKAALWKHRLYKIEDRLFNGGFFKHRVKRVKDPEYMNIPSFKNYYNFRFKRKPTVDNFIIGDWRETLTKRYDLIVNFDVHLVVESQDDDSQDCGWIELRAEFFVTLAPYFGTGRGLWAVPAIFLAVPSHSLSSDSLARIRREYYEQFKPNLAEFVEEIYLFFDPYRPTLDQYVQCAFWKPVSSSGALATLLQLSKSRADL